MGSVTVIFLPILLPFMYLITFFGNLFGVTFGMSTTEVALPYNEETGLVWKCEKNDYGWFELTDTRVEGDTQVFVFEAEAAESHCNEVVFTAENGERLAYRARDVGPAFPLYGKVKLYAPDEYVIYDYVPVPKNKVENAFWGRTASGTQEDDYLLRKTEVEGKTVFTVICFEDVPFSHNYSYVKSDPDEGFKTFEDITATFKYTKENGLQVKEFRQVY